jgi:ABC-type Zn uptake system ZnuABC Zn-binding protein ZnuA
LFISAEMLRLRPTCEDRGIMRQRVCLLIVIALLTFACKPAEQAAPPAAGKTLNIMTTVLPMQNLTLAVTKGAANVQVRQLLPAAGGCPHDYALQPGDLKALENSQVLVAVGLGYEPFLDKLATNYQGRLTIVRAGEGVELIRKGGGGDTEAAEHPFVSPKQAATMAINLAEALAARDPSHAALYRANAAKLKDELLAIHEELARFVAGLSNKRVAVATTVLAYLVRDLGLEQAAVLTGGEHHDLGPGEIAGIIASVKKAPPAAILADEEVDPRVSRMVAGEAGLKMITLKVGLSGAAGPDAFAATLRQMAADLIAGLAS